MTSDSKEKAGQTAKGYDPMAAMRQFQTTGNTPAEVLGKAWLDTVQDTMQELSRFVAERLAKDMETQKEIMGCQNVGDLQQVQARFFTQAVEDYRSESDRLAALARKFLENAKMDEATKGKS